MQHPIMMVTPGQDVRESIMKILADDQSILLIPFESAHEALRQAKERRFEAAIIDCDLGSGTIRDLASSLRTFLPEVRLLIIPSQSENQLFPFLGFLPDGYLWRPFTPEELSEQIHDVIDFPPEDENWQNQTPLEPLFDVPPPEPTQVIEIDRRGELKVESQPERRYPYFLDPENMTGFLQRLVAETGAQDAVVIKDNLPWIHTSQLKEETAEELLNLISSIYPPGSSGEAVLFIHLNTTGSEHQALICYLEEEILLILVFDAKYPFRKIRKLTIDQIYTLLNISSSSMETTNTPEFNRHYAFLLVPQLPKNRLTGAISENLSEWIQEISSSSNWRVEHLTIRPDRFLWVSQASCEESAERQVQLVRKVSSQRLFDKFPALKLGDSRGDFWAPEYLLIETDRLPAPGLVRDFISKIRNQTK